MNFRMLSDIMGLQNSVEAKDATISELRNEIKESETYEDWFRELLDEKYKDIADLSQELREVKEKLSKSEAWNGKEEEE